MGAAAHSAETGDGTITNYAAKVCSDLSYGGYDDWFLPSYAELGEVYKQRATIGGLIGLYYWSSSESSTTVTRAFAKDFKYGGSQYPAERSIDCRIRPIRRF